MLINFLFLNSLSKGLKIHSSAVGEEARDSGRPHLQHLQEPLHGRRHDPVLRQLLLRRVRSHRSLRVGGQRVSRLSQARLLPWLPDSQPVPQDLGQFVSQRVGL